jgi:hypothetical protein
MSFGRRISSMHETYCLHLPDGTVHQMGKDNYEERSVCKPMADGEPPLRSFVSGRVTESTGVEKS